ncbi:MAG: hypothetical protein ACTHJW_16280, partial [Streptosporangiaceae bacterium]
LAGERMFFDSDSSSGVSGDLESATTVASFMEGFWGMGSTVSSYSTARRLEVGSPGGGQGGRKKKGQDPEAEMRHALADRIEDNLTSLLQRTEDLIRENRKAILRLAHALETHKTLTGDDVVAVIDGTAGPLIDGRPYASREFVQQLEDYHARAATAHRTHSHVAMSMPATSPNGSATDGMPQSVTAALEPGTWPSGNGESPSHEQSDSPQPDSPQPDSPQPDSPQSDSPQSDWPQSEWPRSDWPPSDWPQAD